MILVVDDDSLDDCIMMARRQSIDAAVALGELRSAYWQWRSYRADLLPEVSLSGTAPSWNKRYSSYQQADGSLSFVRNDYLGLDGAVNITQKLWPTGGTLSVESSLDYLHLQNLCLRLRERQTVHPEGGGGERCGMRHHRRTGRAAVWQGCGCRGADISDGA